MNDQLKAMLVTLGKTFAVALISFILASGIGVLDMQLGDWKAALGAAITAALMLLVNFLNPKDSRYGIGSGDALGD